MSTKALSEYVRYSRYAKYNPEKSRRETWPETVDRVFDMHERKYEKQLSESEELVELFAEAKQALLKKQILGSQRVLQFGGAPIEKSNLKMFNCAFANVCRDEMFGETMYLLLNGCGCGFSVQKHHIAQLSKIADVSDEEVEFVAEDSIEGWGDCIHAIMSSYFVTPIEGFEFVQGKTIKFNLDKIRPEGAPISGGFKAPGPEGLRASLELIRKILSSRAKESDTLRPIDAYDIIMHLSDACLSGGIRRSATICLFSMDDEEMMSAKTGNWFNENPQRGRSNNSAVLLRPTAKKEDFMKIKESVMEYGEPGFVFMDDDESGTNPCVTGDTIVATNKGEIRMKDLVKLVEAGGDVEAMSYNQESGETEYKKITSGIKTRENASLIKLELEDGRFLKLTPDHKVLTRDGYVKAASLTDDHEILDLGMPESELKDEGEVTVRSYINQAEWTNVVVKL